MRTRDGQPKVGEPRKRVMTTGGFIVFLVLLGLYMSGHLGSRRFAFAEGTGLDGPDIGVLESQNRAYEQIAQAVTPAIVNIQTTQVIKVRQSPFFTDPFFRQFFGNMFGQYNIPRNLREHALGSGVIISPDGYIVTNNHVVAKASDINVELTDQKVYKAKVIGTDPQTDIAVVKIDAKDLPTATWGKSSDAKVGDTVMAFGNPFGLNFTVTRGIVSGIGRSGLGIESFEDFIQTDAAINPGNSGGALVDIHGKVIGINTAIVSPGAQDGAAGFNGVGLAIPSDIVEHVVQSLITTGKVERGYLGVTVADLNEKLAKQFDVPDIGGALVNDVESGSPAEKAGIKQGDVIRSFNGKEVASEGQLVSMTTSESPGAEVTLGILRDGKTMDIKVKLGSRPEKLAATQENSAKAPEKGTLQGLTVANLTDALRQQYSIGKDAEGVVITALDPTSPAAQEGLQPGDVIEEIDHRVVKNVKDFERLSAGLNGDVLLRIDRKGTGLYAVVSPMEEGGIQ